MIKLLAALFVFLGRLLNLLKERKLEEQGRQQAIKEQENEITRQVELAEDVDLHPDHDRDERLRNRFDRSRSGE
jgi:hypothetical protein